MAHVPGEKWSKEEILEALREFNERNGRPPTSGDQMRTENNLPRPMTIRNNFGTWNKALKAAGLQTWQERTNGSRPVWTKEHAIAAIQAYAAKYGSPPAANLVNRRELGIPSQSALVRLFGSYSEGIKQAGLTSHWGGPRPDKEGRYEWTQEKAIAAIQSYVAQHGSPPDAKKGRRDGVPSNWTIRRLFGSHREAVRAAGFTPRNIGSQPGRARKLGVGRFKGQKTPKNEFVGWAFDDRKGEQAELIEKQRRRRKQDGDSD